MKKITFLAAAAALALAAPAMAQEQTPLGAPDPYYFECTGTAPVQTIDIETYSWSATPPADSYRSGAGCGWLDPGVFTGTNQPNAFYDAAFGGEFTGDVRQIDLTLYSAAVNPLLTSKTIDVIVYVNDEEVANLTQLQATPQPGPADQVAKYTWTIPELDIQALRSKQMVIAVSTYYSDDIGGWLQGASEVPSGVKLYSPDDLPAEPTVPLGGLGL